MITLAGHIERIGKMMFCNFYSEEVKVRENFAKVDIDGILT